MNSFPTDRRSDNNIAYDVNNSLPGHADIKIEFYRKSTLVFSVMSLLYISPFALSDLLQGNLVFGLSSTCVMLILVVCFWITSRGHYNIYINLYIMTPVVISFLGYCVIEKQIIGILWCFPALFSFYFILPEKKAWICNGLLLAVILPCASIVLEPSILARTIATLCGTSTFLIIFVHFIEIQRKQLQDIALIDPLTGLSNRNLLESTLARSSDVAQSTGMSMSLLTLDFDHFKNINDQYGHHTGDLTLKTAGKIIKQSIRINDVAFRTGGDEFVVLLFNCKLKNGQSIGEKIRTNIEKMSLIPGMTTTISIGVAEYNANEDWTDWLQCSDDNMYRAKQSGRNSVIN